MGLPRVSPQPQVRPCVCQGREKPPPSRTTVAAISVAITSLPRCSTLVLVPASGYPWQLLYDTILLNLCNPGLWHEMLLLLLKIMALKCFLWNDWCTFRKPKADFWPGNYNPSGRCLWPLEVWRASLESLLGFLAPEAGNLRPRRGWGPHSKWRPSGSVLSGTYFLAARGEDRRTENLQGQLPSGGKNALCVSEEMIRRLCGSTRASFFSRSCWAFFSHVGRERRVCRHPCRDTDEQTLTHSAVVTTTR